MSLFTERRQCLHDLMAKTVVISLNKRSGLIYFSQLCAMTIILILFVILVSMMGIDFDVKQKNVSEKILSDRRSESGDMTDPL